MNNLNLNRQNDLITRRQTYVLNRKLITFHSYSMSLDYAYNILLELFFSNFNNKLLIIKLKDPEKKISR